MDTTPHVLQSTSRLVLENWAMALVDPADRSMDIFVPNEPLFLSKISFRGIINGTVSILAQRAFLDALTANLIGLEPGEVVSEEQSADAFKEMTNVLTGNFLTQAYGDDTVFDIVLPSVQQIGDAEAEALFKGRVVFCFRADEHPLAITFEVEA